MARRKSGTSTVVCMHLSNACLLVHAKTNANNYFPNAESLDARDLVIRRLAFCSNPSNTPAHAFVCPVYADTAISTWTYAWLVLAFAAVVLQLPAHSTNTIYICECHFFTTYTVRPFIFVSVKHLPDYLLLQIRSILNLITSAFWIRSSSK